MKNQTIHSEPVPEPPPCSSGTVALPVSRTSRCWNRFVEPVRGGLPLVMLALTIGLGACQERASGDPGLVTREIYAMNRGVFQSALERVFREFHYAGLPEGSAIPELAFFDMDHTLVDTRTMIPYRSAGSLTYNALSDSKCMTIGPDEPADYAVLNREELLGSAPVAPGLAGLREASARGVPAFIVTSRGSSDTFTVIPEYLEKHGARVSGVFAVNSRYLSKHVWWKLELPPGIKSVPGHMKKPLIIAAILDRARTAGAWPKLVRYHEDTDSHFRGTMFLLNLMYPEIRFELIDYIRTARGNDFEYTRKEAAVSEGKTWLDPAGQPLTDPRLYDSGDCVEPPYPPVEFR